MKNLTWKEVRDYLNTCTDQQLSRPACVQRLDELPTYIVEMNTNEEDLVWNDEMVEGSIPVSEYDAEEYGIPFESDENIIYPKGSLLWGFDSSFMDSSEEEEK